MEKLRDGSYKCVSVWNVGNADLSVLSSCKELAKLYIYDVNGIAQYIPLLKTLNLDYLNVETSDYSPEEGDLLFKALPGCRILYSMKDETDYSSKVYEEEYCFHATAFVWQDNDNKYLSRLLTLYFHNGSDSPVSAENTRLYHYEGGE